MANLLLQPARSPNESLCRLRVLVVDDFRDAAESLTMLLGYWGHEAEVAETGPEALELARSFRPHVVLTEIALQGMDGYQLAARFLESAGLDRPLLIALTTQGGEAVRLRVREAGFGRHFLKPADPAELEELLLLAHRAFHPRLPLNPA